MMRKLAWMMITKFFFIFDNLDNLTVHDEFKEALGLIS